MRSTRSIERHGTSFVMTQWAVCAAAMKVTAVRETLQPYLYAREERLDRAEQIKGADPRTERTTTREPDWSERKVDLNEIDTWRLS